MEFYRTDDEALTLMPGHGQGLHVVLFWNPETDREHVVLDHYRATEWPEHTQHTALDVAAAPQTVAWFGLTNTPALTVVRDGVLLAVEYGCSEEACQRLLDCAERQLRSILSEE